MLEILQLLELDYGANLHGAFAGAGNAARDGDGFVEIVNVYQEKTAELLASFGERAVGYRALTFADAYARGSGHWPEGRGGHKLAGGFELMCQIARFAIATLAFGFRPGLLIGVNQQHVFHCAS